MAELADALDSKSSGRKAVWVRAPPPAVSFGCWTLGVRCSKTLIKIGDTSGLRVRLRRKQRPHGLTREHDNRKDAENCSKGKEEAFDTSHHEGE